MDARIAAPATPSITHAYYADRRFIARIRDLQVLRSFIWSEGLPLPDNADEYLLGESEAFRYSRTGNAPSKQEWEQIERLYYRINSMIPQSARQRLGFYQRQNIPSDVLVVSAILITLSFLAFTGVVHPEVLARIEQIFIGHLPTTASIQVFDAAIWCLSLGALGAIANVSFNALLIQSDIGFDITRRKLVYLRIILGSLFGLVLSLPLSYRGFLAIAELLDSSGAAKDIANPGDAPQLSQVILLLLPFVLGFSTSLILKLLERISGAVAALFGADGARHHADSESDTLNKRRP